jgi:N6-L-threonylcarbamoyladenine synthase/N6-L-threonylcarbamoyladenine synthase/protein kinase Bud32
MSKKMCDERLKKTQLFVPDNSLLVDNGAMIAFAGEIMFNSGIKIPYDKTDKLDIEPRQRTDDVEISWRK